MGGGALSVSLDALDGDELAIAGGKAVNLGRLRKAGLPVPDGFCITTRAYLLAADGVRADAPAALRDLLQTRPVPDAVAEAVTEAYRGLGQDVPVAVRSSATAEDLPAASFAGQHDTFLNVVGEEALLDALRGCWASLWTDRAVAYRAANGIEASSVQLAVIVQRMVDARAAGVMFTANPLTGRRGQAVIDVAPGLGEAVVSGAVNPDHFVVDTAQEAVLERAVRNPEPTLDDAQLAALAVLARRVESLYGTPQDTEFAVGTDGRVWLLQARPVTTLFPLPEDAPPPSGADLRVYFNFNLAQGVLRPLTPMGLQVFLLGGSGMAAATGAPSRDRLAGPPVMKPAAGWLFFDVSPLVRSRLGRRLMLFVMARMEARSAAVLDALMSDPRLALPPGITGPGSVASVRRTAALLWTARIPARVLRALRDPVRGREETLRRARLLSEASIGIEDGTAAQRLELAERVLAERLHASLLAVAPVAFAGLGSFAFAFRLLGRRVTAEERDAVRRALPHNPTTQMDLALWSLAMNVRADEEAARVLLEGEPVGLAAAYAAGALPAVLQEGLGEFLRNYGHRGVAEIDLGLPRWGDDPTPVLSILASYLRRDVPDGGPQAQFRAVAEQAEALVEELARRRGRLLGPVVRSALRRGRELAGLREVPKATVMALTARVRSDLLVPVGEELTISGIVEQPDDLFFVDLREARSLVNGGDFRAEIRERRAIYDREVRRRHVPRVLLSDGTEPAPQQFGAVGEAAPGAAGGDGVLRGAPASAGVATGPSKVILEPLGAHLVEGEILVAPSTDPGWTPLFLTASGLVMEMGGAMSHGAVVAREYGIPAVVGVPDATERIRSGDRVTVDGTAGTVVIGDAAPVPVWEPPIPGSTWVRRQVVEHMPDPLSPLFEDLYLGEGLARSYDQIMELMAFPVHRMVDPPFFATVNGFAYSRGDIRLPPRMIPTMVRAISTGMRLVFRQGLAEWRDRALPAYLATVERWRRADPGTLSERELLRGVRELAWADAEYWFPVALVVGAAKVSDDLLRQFLRVVVRNEELSPGRFLRGYPSKTLDADAALEDLADRIRSADALRRAVLETPPQLWPEVLGSIAGGPAVLEGIDAYFRDYGHQIYSLDFVEPTPADDRVPTLQSLQARVSRQSRDVQALRAALARQRDADVEQTAAALDPVRRRAFLAVLRWAQRHAPGREESLFYLGAAWPTLRELARELGHRLVSTGSIDDPDDVFFLESAELESVADGPPRPELAERARQRRALREERRRLHAPAAVPPTARMRLGAIDMSSRETQKRNVETATTLSGFPVSPGRVTAPASVVLGPEHFDDMAAGSILVCPTTSPAWTPLFGQARGLVTDIGGVLAHGSIVAREYGIPAVMGTGNGTRRIRHGQMITIDGDRGVVELHEQ